MTAQSIIGTYTAPALDEMRDPAGSLRPHWAAFIASLEQMGHDALVQNERELRRLVRLNGVTYNVHRSADIAQRPWKLDILPYIISAADWQTTQAGIQQRAELYDLILNDLYGAQNIIKEGIVPMELVYEHTGFVRPAYNIKVPDNRRLLSCAIDVARGPDGRMWVIGSRVQSPSGMGYALENRTVMARVFGEQIRGNHVHRLANFFTQYQNTLDRLAPQRDNPTIAFLTPGPYNESYFEHAYLASYLGYELVQGADLQVRDGTICLKTLEGLQPIDVMVRRVNDLYCDPLELRDDSYIGVAGLLEAARRGKVALANPIGCGILENSGLIPFLPALSDFFLDTDLLLPSAATWWCGQEKERDYVLDNLDDLLIKRTDRSAFAPTIQPNRLSAAEHDTLRQAILAEPNRYIGQEIVHYSTVPSLVNGQFIPRPTFLRTFTVASENGYQVMPGGLARSVDENQLLYDSPDFAHISKDAWVLGEENTPYISLWTKQSRLENTFRQSFHISSRTAENLYWVGRYAERVDGSVRVLRTLLGHLSSEETGDDASDEKLRDVLLNALHRMAGLHKEGDDDDETSGRDLYDIAFDATLPGSVISNLNAMSQAAFNVRDFWSTDSWRLLQQATDDWQKLSKQPRHDLRLSQLETAFSQLLMSLITFAGLNAEVVTRTAGWLLLDGGRRIERSLFIIDLLRTTLATTDTSADPVILETLLRTNESIITYRRRYRAWLHVNGVLDLLMLEEANPRSLLYQVNRLQNHINHLPADTLPHRLRREQQIMLDLTTRIRLTDTAQLLRSGGDGVHYNLLDTLDGYKASLQMLSNILTQRYFSHTQQQRPLVAIAPSVTEDV